jgi:hypothetical protein
MRKWISVGALALVFSTGAFAGQDPTSAAPVAPSVTSGARAEAEWPPSLRDFTEPLVDSQQPGEGVPAFASRQPRRSAYRFGDAAYVRFRNAVETVGELHSTPEARPLSRHP